MSWTSWEMMLPRGDIGFGGIVVQCGGFARGGFFGVSGKWRDNVNCLWVWGAGGSLEGLLKALE